MDIAVEFVAGLHASWGALPIDVYVFDCKSVGDELVWLYGVFIGAIESSLALRGVPDVVV